LKVDDVEKSGDEHLAGSFTLLERLFQVLARPHVVLPPTVATLVKPSKTKVVTQNFNPSGM
jgi:hypothetical protein